MGNEFYILAGIILANKYKIKDPPRIIFVNAETRSVRVSHADCIEEVEIETIGFLRTKQVVRVGYSEKSNVIYLADERIV